MPYDPLRGWGQRPLKVIAAFLCPNIHRLLKLMESLFGAGSFLERTHDSASNTDHFEPIVAYTRGN